MEKIIKRTAVVLCTAIIAATATGLSASAAEPKQVIVFDDNSAWTDHTVIDLFERNELGNQLVYPGVTGNYSFTVRNTDDTEHECEVIIEDENKFSIPLDVRIKKNGEYIIGSDTEWTRSANFDSGVYILPSKENIFYELEWKWDYYVSDDLDQRDTSMGKQARYETEPYNIKINVLADVEPPESSEPSDPSEPSTPSDPSEPSEPSMPSDPSEPSETSTPSDPSEPSEPSTPSAPSEPSETSTPSAPSGPSETSTPSVSTPSNPSTPSTFQSSTPQVSQPDDKPTTGDSQNIWIPVCFALSSVIALAVTAATKQKSK